MVDPLKIFWVLTNSTYLVTKFIRIGIADKNDNPPYFDKELYEAEVDENEDIQHTVLTVTAKDHDEWACVTTRYKYRIDCDIGRKSQDISDIAYKVNENFPIKLY
ncbi:unnamed protein product [Parnassius apollo]|uniref:(apollo) hypothetical protein n=1 Tax=Parnassius apollo TaxID=110799 RepID=A0A8S3XFJ3_PARAO|nr:unnamed protein product [Parnassius apollo]